MTTHDPSGETIMTLDTSPGRSTHARTIAGASVLALALFVAVAAAQDGPRMRRPGMAGPGPGPGGPGGPPMAGLLHELDLSDEQREQVRAIHEKEREALKPVIEKADAARQAFDKALNAENADAQTVGQAALAMKAAQSQVEAAHKATLEQVKAILTPEQAARLEEIQKRRPRMGPAGAFGPGGAGAPRRPRPDGDAAKR
jgi:Spy/CpxP family protein refolding chaperone